MLDQDQIGQVEENCDQDQIGLVEENCGRLGADWTRCRELCCVRSGSD